MDFADIVSTRRDQLGLSINAAAAASEGMISASNWKKAENRQQPVESFRRKSLIGICRALRWPDSAVDSLRRHEWPSEERNGVVTAKLELSGKKFTVERLKGDKLTEADIADVVEFLRNEA